MTTFEFWKANATPHSPFVRALFECYLLATEEEKQKLNRAFPGFFVTQRNADLIAAAEHFKNRLK